MYQGVQGACPRQAVTSAGVTAKRSERHDVGTGLKLVHNNLTTKEYIVQKKLCHLDHNWQSYIETLFSLKMMTKR